MTGCIYSICLSFPICEKKHGNRHDNELDIVLLFFLFIYLKTSICWYQKNCVHPNNAAYNLYVTRIVRSRLWVGRGKNTGGQAG